MTAVDTETLHFSYFASLFGLAVSSECVRAHVSRPMHSRTSVITMTRHDGMNTMYLLRIH